MPGIPQRPEKLHVALMLRIKLLKDVHVHADSCAVHKPDTSTGPFS